MCTSSQLELTTLRLRPSRLLSPALHHTRNTGLRRRACPSATRNLSLACSQLCLSSCRSLTRGTRREHAACAEKTYEVARMLVARPAPMHAVAIHVAATLQPSSVYRTCSISSNRERRARSVRRSQAQVGRRRCSSATLVRRALILDAPLDSVRVCTIAPFRARAPVRLVCYLRVHA